jgi:aspartyl-tRNA(Asn)/glutamyl-tRNA(Gln) amidotransferase subunit C
MSLDKTAVGKIAFLARINVPEDELESLAGELSGILDWVDMLNQVDTQNVSPMSSVAKMTLKKRQDVVSDGDCRDDVLKNAPNSEDDYFTVPKVIE